MKDLEKGYEEAWLRWVWGVDTEDGPEVENLLGGGEGGVAGEEGKKGLRERVGKSGHIWVADL